MSHRAVLLQSDIVDSTKITDSLGDADLGRLWASFDVIARDLLIAWRGEELARSDGFLMRFDSVPDAVGYAIALHRALRTLTTPIAVRVGIHAGTLDYRTNQEAHVRAGARSIEAAGVSIPITVRIMSLAVGGQTLLSRTAYESLDERPPRTASHGFWRLKGIAEPVEIFEAGDIDAVLVSPKDVEKAYQVVRQGERWLPVREVPHSLPAERNAFVGRVELLRELERRIDEGARLLTVLGTGGTGKTRFVQHFGWEHQGEYAGGVWFCDLSQASTFEGLCGAVAQGLGLQLGAADLVEQIGNAIAGRGRALFIFDNFEQVTRFARQTLGPWLDRGAMASFVVTSRNVLGLDGEEILELPVLSPAEGRSLFDLRSRSASARRIVDPRQSQAVADVVAMLDGLPLAIELAAARVRAVSVTALLDDLQERFSLLSSRDGRPTRQATLQATFDWSWDLLTPAEQAVFAQLAVFDGGFDLPAYEAIIDFADAEADPLDVLQSLIDQSLVQRRGESRYGLLRTIHRHAWQRLHRGSVDARLQDALARHWRYYGALGEHEATADACIEIDNLISATRRAIHAHDASGAVDALLAAWWAVRRRGPFNVAAGLGQTVLAMEGLTPRESMIASYVSGSAWRHSGTTSHAEAAFTDALESAGAPGTETVHAWVLAALGELQTHTRRHADAATSLDQALRIAVGLRNEPLQAAILNSVGALEQNAQRPEAALPHYQRALAFARNHGDRHLEGGILGNLGGALHTLGRLDEAEDHYRRALALAEWSGSERWKGNTRCNLGLLFHERGNTTRAIEELDIALAQGQSLGHLRLECTAGWNLGLAYQQAGEREKARAAFGNAHEVALRLHDQNAIAELEQLLASIQAA